MHKWLQSERSVVQKPVHEQSPCEGSHFDAACTNVCSSVATAAAAELCTLLCHGCFEAGAWCLQFTGGEYASGMQVWQPGQAPTT